MERVEQLLGHTIGPHVVRVLKSRGVTACHLLRGLGHYSANGYTEDRGEAMIEQLSRDTDASESITFEQASVLVSSITTHLGNPQRVTNLPKKAAKEMHIQHQMHQQMHQAQMPDVPSLPLFDPAPVQVHPVPANLAPPLKNKPSPNHSKTAGLQPGRRPYTVEVQATKAPTGSTLSEHVRAANAAQQVATAQIPQQVQLPLRTAVIGGMSAAAPKVVNNAAIPLGIAEIDSDDLLD